MLDQLNGRHHLTALMFFSVFVLAHWAEHATQAVQIWLFDTPLKEARGALGEFFPWLVTSEWMHYFYAIGMLIGFLVLRPGFTGAAKTWWTVALGVQAWHHVEHLLLLLQKLTDTTLGDSAVQTSIAQQWFPRVELHLFYNAVVTLPMLVAIFFYCRRDGSITSHQPLLMKGDHH